jgi:hypothetical protein
MLEDEQTFSLGEFVDDPYNKDLTVKASGSRGVYDKFMHIFSANKVPRVVF